MRSLFLPVSVGPARHSTDAVQSSDVTAARATTHVQTTVLYGIPSIRSWVLRLGRLGARSTPCAHDFQPYFPRVSFARLCSPIPNCRPLPQVRTARRRPIRVARTLSVAAARRSWGHSRRTGSLGFGHVSVSSERRAEAATLRTCEKGDIQRPDPHSFFSNHINYMGCFTCSKYVPGSSAHLTRRAA